MKLLSAIRTIQWICLLLLCPLCGSAWADHRAEMGVEVEAMMLSDDLRLITEKATDYQHGRGVEQNLDRAIGLYCVAAIKGNSRAQYELGWVYFNARHGRSNDAQAVVWLTKAAQTGDDHAQRLLRFLSPSDLDVGSLCPLSSGENFLPPIEGKDDPSVAEIQHWVERLAPHYQLTPQLVVEVIRAESNFNVKAHSNKNARGLMQLIPVTAKRFGVEDIWDPLQNIQGGMAYLQWLLSYFKGDRKLALAGYNAGEKAVDSFRGVPPYAETRRYVRLITGKLNSNPPKKTNN